MPKRVYSLVERIALLSTQQGGYASRQDIVTHLGTASQQAFNALLPAKTGRPVGPGLNRSLDTRLKPFMRRQDYNEQPTGSALPMSTGQFTLPAECAYVDYYDLPGGAVMVREVEGHAFRTLRFDPVEGPTVKYPIVGTVENGDKQIYPAETARATVQYYAYPAEPVYAETYVDNVATYDDSASVDTGWGPEMDSELIVRTLRLLGLEIRDPALQQAAAQFTAETL